MDACGAVIVHAFGGTLRRDALGGAPPLPRAQALPKILRQIVCAGRGEGATGVSLLAAALQERSNAQMQARMQQERINLPTLGTNHLQIRIRVD